MFAKLIAIIVFATVLGAVVLGLRQHRLETMHEMTRQHQRVDDMRQALWQLQDRIAEDCQPARLRQAIDAAGLELEPMTPLATDRQSRWMVSTGDHGAGN